MTVEIGNFLHVQKNILEIEGFKANTSWLDYFRYFAMNRQQFIILGLYVAH